MGIEAPAEVKYGIIYEAVKLDKDNALIRSLKATIQRLTKAFRDTLPGVADALETMRQTNRRLGEVNHVVQPKYCCLRGR